MVLWFEAQINISSFRCDNIKDEHNDDNTINTNHNNNNNNYTNANHDNDQEV